MKNVRWLIILFTLVILGSGCASKDSEFERIPVILGEQPANDANAHVGTWNAEDFEITSKGEISGRFELKVSRPIDYPVYQDVLFVQIRSYYIWPIEGDWMIKSAGEFIPVFASHSADKSAIFELQGKFEVPAVEIDVDGGMPLDYLEVTMVWYRVIEVSETGMSSFGAKLGYFEQNWKGTQLINRESNKLSGTLDTNVRGGLEYPQWLMKNMVLPNAVPPTVMPSTLLSPFHSPLQ